MTDQFVTLERREDGVAVLRLDRPKVNAMSTELLRQLAAVGRALNADLPGAVVVTGGDRNFAAGFEISEMPVGTAGGGADLSDTFRAALEQLASMPRFVIAAINGVALGGGLELALACDWRIAADNARLGVPEVLLGILPGAGGTQRLPRLVGSSRAKEMAMTGRQVPAEEALRIGLVDEVVPAGQVQARALEKAAELARGALVAQGYIKQAIDQGMDHDLDRGIEHERELFDAVLLTEDAAIGVRSFLENGPGKASFVGR